MCVCCFGVQLQHMHCLLLLLPPELNRKQKSINSRPRAQSTATAGKFGRKTEVKQYWSEAVRAKRASEAETAEAKSDSAAVGGVRS